LARNNLVVSFSENEEIIAEITNMMKNDNQDYFEFLGATGSIKEFSLLSSGQNASLNTMSYDEPFTINSVSGKIEKRNGKYIPTIYLSVTKTGVGSVSGQLVKAKAVEGLEFTIRKVNMKKIILG